MQSGRPIDSQDSPIDPEIEGPQHIYTASESLLLALRGNREFASPPRRRRGSHASRIALVFIARLRERRKRS